MRSMRAAIPYRIPVKLSVRISIDANKRKRMSESSQSDFIARPSFVCTSRYSNFLLVFCFDVSTVRVRETCLFDQNLGTTFLKALHHVWASLVADSFPPMERWIPSKTRNIFPAGETGIRVEYILGYVLSPTESSRKQTTESFIRIGPDAVCFIIASGSRHSRNGPDSMSFPI